ncbi:MAG TPA: hypothetical protein VEG40_08660 [Gaiellaceae bacterium]|nr:hypothetical protein [Gaiellaceae bacterium]
MSAGDLSEHALFEVADIASAAGLATRLAERWSVVVSAERPDTFCVVAELRGDSDDVALLLREVEAWVEREAALALRFELDGRAYVLEAGEPDWSANLAAESHAERAGRRARLLAALSSIDRALSAHRAPGRHALQIRGLEDLRQDISLALRLENESP